MRKVGFVLRITKILRRDTFRFFLLHQHDQHEHREADGVGFYAGLDEEQRACRRDDAEPCRHGGEEVALDGDLGAASLMERYGICRKAAEELSSALETLAANKERCE